MPWNFEKVFEIPAGSGCTSLAFDGKYVWVVGGTTVKKFDFWGPEKLNELEYDTLNDLLYTDKLTEVASITLAYTGTQLVYAQGSMYVMLNAADKKIAKINVLINAVTYITLPEQMDSNLAYGDGKLWMVSKAPETQTSPDTQKLYYMNCSNNTFNAGVHIPTPKQSVERQITYGYNGHVYVTNYNDVSVSKHSSTDGAWVARIVVNGDPTGIKTAEDRTIWVSSRGGMLSSIDPTTDAVTHSHGTLAPVMKFVDDGAYIWTINPETGKYLVRVNKSSKNILVGVMDGDEDTIWQDYEANMEKFTSVPFVDLLITPKFMYDAWGTSGFSEITVEQYFFALSATKLMCFRKHKYLIRENQASVKAIAMISSGEKDYTGD